MVMSWVTLVTAFRDNPRGLLVTHLRIHNEKKRQRFVRFSVLFHFFLQERSLFIWDDFGLEWSRLCHVFIFQFNIRHENCISAKMQRFYSSSISQTDRNNFPSFSCRFVSFPTDSATYNIRAANSKFKRYPAAEQRKNKLEMSINIKKKRKKRKNKYVPSSENNESYFRAVFSLYVL